MSETDVQDTELPLESVGIRLSNARRQEGLSLGDVAARTKIAERHLISIEEDRFSDLAGKTYAVGFSRAFARAVGLDEGEIAQGVRDQLSKLEDSEERPRMDAFEPGDPARVPPSRLAWVSILGAVGVIAVVLIFWRSFLAPAGSLPDLTKEETAAPPSVAKEPEATSDNTKVAQGPVVFTALEPKIWVKFYDASGEQLMQKQMEQGESYTIPTEAEGPQIWTARPDALEITVGGRVIPRLAEVPLTLKDEPVSAAALLAKNTAGANATDGQTPTELSTPNPASPTAETTQASPQSVSSPTSSSQSTASSRSSSTRSAPSASAESARAPATRSPVAGSDRDEPSTDSE